jgi:hypothetical protein
MKLATKKEIQAVRFFSRDGCLYLKYIDNHKSLEKKATELEDQLKKQMKWRQINGPRMKILMDFLQKKQRYYEDIFDNAESIIQEFSNYDKNRGTDNTQVAQPAGFQTSCYK